MVVGVDPDKPGAEADLRPGDIILKANMQSVNSPADLSKMVKEAKDNRGAIILQVMRGKSVFFRSLSIPKK